MRIALFSDTYFPEINGVATATTTLQKILNDGDNFCVTVTTNPYSSKVTFEDNVIRIPGIEAKKLYGYRFAFLYNSKVKRILDDLKIDVVHIQTEVGIGIFGKLYAKMKKIPFVYTYHTMYEDYTYYATKGFADPFAKRVVRSFSRWQANSASEFIAPSTKTKDAMRDYGVQRYINIVPTGIDFKKFLLENNDADAIYKYKKKLGFDKTFNIIYLGRVAKEKGIDVLIRGFRSYVSNNPATEVRMLIVGGGPALEELKKLSEDLKMNSFIHFVGKVMPSEVPFYYHLGDVFASASVSETQGLTFMEAMAAHKILLAKYDENLVNVIKDRETGFFFDNEEDFGKKIDLVKNLKAEERVLMENKAYDLAQAYSLEKFKSNILTAYYRAIRNHW